MWDTAAAGSSCDPALAASATAEEVTDILRSCVLVENAMVDGAATGALQAPSVAPAVAWAQRMTRTLPPWYPLLLRWPRGHSLTPLTTLAAMWGVVEVKEGLGRTNHWLCGRHMGLSGSAGTNKGP
jgi:hypothetical protein